MRDRVRALLAKEFADLRRNPGVFIPAMLTSLVALVLPFFVAVIVPAVTGERLSDSSDFYVATGVLLPDAIPHTRAAWGLAPIA